MKQKYYRLDKILKLNAEYNILLGERSNGKSYAAKEYAIRRAYTDQQHCKFILLRRWDLELKPTLAEQYFADAPISVITDGEADGVSVYRGEIWLTRYDEEQKKNIKRFKIGYTRALSMEQHYSSGAYPDVDTVIFEEFISRDYYLPQEPLKLMQLISTVARRRAIKVFMIGNTISRLCPYFEEWQLVNTPKQKQGTIETYTYDTSEIDDDGKSISVVIAVEFCENSGRNSHMFFGASSNMITTGAWQSKEMPHLNGSRQLNYDLIYTVFIQVAAFNFKCELLSDHRTNALIWFVSPKTTPIKKDDRLITDRMNLINCITTIGLKPLSPGEAQAFALMNEGKICYSDNLTGSDFEVCLKQLKNS